MATMTIEALRSKQRRTDPAKAGELGEANALGGDSANHNGCH
jgi:hypothetical protein